MAVITVDRLIEGVKRDALLDWLADLDHHARFLAPAFARVSRDGATRFNCTLKTSRFRTLEIGLVLDEVDRSHGGRRLKMRLEGRRTSGTLSYSLRTMKPSSRTLITLHADYEAGRVLGPMLDAAMTRSALEQAMRTILEGIDSELPRGS